MLWSGDKQLCDCYSFESCFFLVVVQVPQGTRLQNVSLLGKYGMKISHACIKGDGAFLTTNIIVYMPEDEDQKMNHF